MDVLKKNRFNPIWQAILKQRRRRRIVRALLSPALGVLLGILLAALAWHLSADEPLDSPTASQRALELEMERARTLAKVDLALQLHRLIHGEYPLSLETLVAERLLESSALERSPWVHQLSYRLTPEGYILEEPRF